MSTVSMSDFRTHISRYVREVRRGGEVQILRRGVPVAMLVPEPAGGDEAQQRKSPLKAPGVRPSEAVNEDRPGKIAGTAADLSA